MVGGVHSVYDQPDSDAAHAQLDRLLDYVDGKLPDAFEHLDAARVGILAFTGFLEGLWHQIWSNNPDERLNPEISPAPTRSVSSRTGTRSCDSSAPSSPSRPTNRPGVACYLGLDILTKSRLTLIAEPEARWAPTSSSSSAPDTQQFEGTRASEAPRVRWKFSNLRKNESHGSTEEVQRGLEERATRLALHARRDPANKGRAIKRIASLEREIRELRRANEILKIASSFSRRRSSTAS